MADKLLDSLFDDAFQMRIKGVPNGNVIHWSPRQKVEVKDYFQAHRDNIIQAAATARKSVNVEQLPAQSTFSVGGITVRRDAQPADLSFLGRFSCKVEDLVSDIVDPNGIDRSDYNKNPVISAFHDTSVLPLATAGATYVSGDSLLGVINFPAPGTSAASDEVAAAIRAKLIRGVSIGFQPLTFKFSKDPNRPTGIDFLSVRLLEVAICSVPCCPPCLILGAVSSNKSAVSPREPTTREQRIAEAAGIRRAVYSI